MILVGTDGVMVWFTIVRVFVIACSVCLFFVSLNYACKQHDSDAPLVVIVRNLKLQVCLQTSVK